MSKSAAYFQKSSSLLESVLCPDEMVAIPEKDCRTIYGCMYECTDVSHVCMYALWSSHLLANKCMDQPGNIRLPILLVDS